MDNVIVKSQNAIMFIANRDLKFALATMLINLQNVVPYLDYEVVVIHDGFTEDDMSDLSKVCNCIKYIPYTLKDFQNEHKSTLSSKAEAFINRYTHLAYVKYKIFDLMGQYKKVLFLDLDTIVTNDISELFNIEGVAWRNGVSFYTGFSIFISPDDYPEIKSNIPMDYPKPNAGLLYVSLDEETAKKCLKSSQDFITKFMDKIVGACDELAISYATCVHKVMLTQLSNREYNVLPRNYLHSTKVVHLMGKRKQWNDDLMQLAFPKWFEYYDKAYEISDFTSEKIVRFDDIGAIIIKYQNQNQWLEFMRESHFIVPDLLQMDYKFDKPTLKMNYNSDIYYEFKFDQDAGNVTYAICLSVKNRKLLDSSDFLNDLRSIKINDIPKLSISNDSQRIYVTTSKFKVTQVAHAFDLFYNITSNYIFKYLEASDKKTDEDTKHLFLVLDEGILRLTAKDYFKTIISAKNRYTIFISGKDDCSKYFSEFINITSFPLSPTQWRESYIAVVSEGKTIVENASENRIQYSFRLNINPTLWVTITSEGYRLKKEKSSILINNIDYSMNLRGLNFVVVDNLSGYVVDFFNIDTYGDKTFSINRSDEMIKRVRSLEYDLLTTL